MQPQIAPDGPAPLGVHADTGRPLDEIDEASLEALVKGTEATEEDPSLAARANPAGAHFGMVGDVGDPNDIAEAGWGVIFGASVTQRIKDALKPLLDHRKAKTDDTLYKIFEGPTGVQPGDTATKWLARRGVRMDVVEPAQGVPFHIMIVAPPDEVSFEFQYGLDIYWSVGRLWFDTPEQFEQYAQSVVKYETMQDVPTTRQAVLFSPQHDFDRATQLFCKQVSDPLVNGSGSAKPMGQRQQFKLQSFVGEPATKNTLHNIFHGGIANGPPAMLFTGSHGMGFRPDDPRLSAAQGALVCQDWEGFGAITDQHWFAGSDLGPDAKVHGMIHVLFACYGAGCPQFDNFNRASNKPKQVAPKPMLSRLPQDLLSHPNGGALAVLGHVERAWAYSFQSSRGGAQIQGFRDVVGRMLRGDCMGQATDQFNVRWAALSTELSEVLADIQFGQTVPPQELANRWVARDDARNYIIFGDPAVRLRVTDMTAIA